MVNPSQQLADSTEFGGDIGEAFVYHYTSLAHLPWILNDGFLRGRPARGVWPADLVWSTTSDKGDRTTAICRASREHVKVRIKIPARLVTADWRGLALANGWEAEQILRLAKVSSMMGQHDTSVWRACVGPVKIDDCLGASFKSWSGKWQDLDEQHPFQLLGEVNAAQDMLAFKLYGQSWVSIRDVRDDGRQVVACTKVEEKNHEA